ncbi:MAG: DUF2313 domain-containing protein [Parvibaculum sp.]|nr:DUF2313 domain-containing protein [Parvibaculum sp.]
MTCGATSDDYLQQFRALLPQGPAWTRDPDAVMSLLLGGLSVEWARVHARDCVLLSEMNPISAQEMLADWERVLGLPDGCGLDIPTVAGRRSAVLTKLRSIGGQSPGYFINLGANYGFDVSITEFRPFRAGVSSIGDSLTNGDWVFTFLVTSPTETIQTFRAGRGAAGEPLRLWGNEALECLISRDKPSHTIVIFTYSGDPVEV